MRKNGILWTVLLTVFLSVLLGSCQNGGREQTGEYQLYFPVSRDISYGSALTTQSWEGGGEAPTPEELLQALLSGPTQEGLRSPFPGAVTLQSLELDEGRKLMRVTLSEQYGGLTDMAQTLADACIVMTLCQFPDIEAVEISSDGFWASRPASRTLSLAELELDTLLP